MGAQMEYQKLFIVIAVIVFLLLTLLVVKLLQRNNVLPSQSSKMKVTSSVNLVRETSAHILQYEQTSLLVITSKNATPSVTIMASNKETLED